MWTYKSLNPQNLAQIVSCGAQQGVHGIKFGTVRNFLPKRPSVFMFPITFRRIDMSTPDTRNAELARCGNSE